MDVVLRRRRRLPRYALPAAGIAALAVLVVVALEMLGRSHAGATVVDRSTIVTDVVRRGALVRSVSAPGTFEPDRIQVVSATQSGVISQIYVKPGSTVHAGSAIAQLENPDLDAAIVAASSQLDVARANLASAQQQANASSLTQQSALADAQAQMQQDRVEVDAQRSLHTTGLVSDVDYRKAIIEHAKAKHDVAIGRAQIEVGSADAHAKIAAAQAQVEQAAAALAAARAQAQALTVRTAAPGVVQSVALDPGARVAQGTELTRVADQRSLKAVLQVSESEVHAVLVGMPARIDTGNGIVIGRVSRIAPAALNGTVEVDVSFDRNLPSGARPDANVDGAIVLSRIPNALSIARPAGANDGSTIDVFKVVDRGTRAVRVRVRLGVGSNERVAVLSGLKAGDEAIISDTSGYADQSELRLR